MRSKSIGRVRVYQLDGNEWQLRGNEINGKVRYGGFGIEVEINAAGTIVAISESVDDVVKHPGNVEVYKFDGNDWVQLGQTLSGAENGERFGVSMSLDYLGTILAVGMPSFYVQNKTGSVQVYRYENGSWQPLGSRLDGVHRKDHFGASVSLNVSGTILVVGAPKSSLNETESGYTQIFQLINNEWEQIGDYIFGMNKYDAFGRLNSAGNIVAIGAHREYLSVFEYINNSWLLKGSTIMTQHENSGFGNYISLNSVGDFLAVGMPSFNFNTGGADVGKIATYKFIGNDWDKIGRDIYGEHEGDASGTGLSLNNRGSIVAIGANGNDDGGYNAGHVRVYDLLERVGIKEYSLKENAIVAYPNPANDILNIQAESSISSIEIMNVLGQTLLTSKGKSNREQLDISGLNAGNYFVKVVVGDGNKVLRVVKR
ncbi:MAG: T9SS type A sorting domain-containing protein [Aequorivita sp.]